MAEPPAVLAAALAGRYAIARALGAGGMATVYLAHDVRHDRDVALKVLRPELAAVLGAARFLQEIHISARLDHPHILTLIDSGESDGFVWYVLPYVRGESLRAKLTREKQLSIEETVRIAKQVASALDYAHRQGVIHRDIKPENILLHEGEPVVTDFGIALAVLEAGGSRLTESGLSLGTPQYMSPEQAMGDRDVDARSDEYSLATVVYEMLAGEPPHTGPTVQAVIAKLLAERPARIRVVRDTVPERLDAAVSKALAKVPADRFARVAEFAAALEEGRGGQTVGWRHRAKLAAASIGGAVAVVGLITVVRLSQHSATSAAPVHGPSRGVYRSVAVLPLANVGERPEEEYFSDGMTDELTSALGKVPGLRVASRTSAFAFRNPADMDVRKIGRALNVESVLEGSVQRAGNRLRVTAQLTSVTDGLALWSESYDRDLRDVFQVQDDVSQAIINALQGQLATGSAVPAAPSRVVNLKGHDLYLRGRFYFYRFTEADLRRSLELFEQALALDSGYAPAWAGIADVWSNLADDWVSPAEGYPRAKAAARRALALDSTLGEAHAALGAALMWYDWEFSNAEHEFQLAIRLSPNFADAYKYYGRLLRVFQRYDSALSVLRAGQSLDPLWPALPAEVGLVQVSARRYGNAVEACHQALALDSTSVPGQLCLGSALLWAGKPAEALRVFDHPEELAVLRSGAGYADATLGRRADALRIATELIQQSRHRYVRAETIAAIYAALNEPDTAFDWLEKAFRARSAGLTLLKADPQWDRIRNDPRFTALVRKVGIR